MATQFEIDCAIMAGRAYQSKRDPLNQFPAPLGWSEFFHVPDPLNPAFPTTSGFEAVAFKNKANPNQIVISFTGTDPADITGDIAADLALAAGNLSVQLKQAADYYLQIRQSNPGATITFTGHSLGGGLAALMAVMFGEKAVTFDQAPFLNSAKTFTATDPATGDTIPRSVAIDLRDYLANHASDNALKKLDDFIAASNPFNASPIQSDTLASRSGQVTNINMKGEFLSTVPWNIPDRIGTTVLDIKNGGGISGQPALHCLAYRHATKRRYCCDDIC